MREDAIRFVNAVYKWRYDHEDADKKTASKLALKLAKIENSKLPSGPFGPIMLQVLALAYCWRSAPSDGMNDEELSEWLDGKDLAGLISLLVEHEGPPSEPPGLFTSDAELLEVMLEMGATADTPYTGEEILQRAKKTTEGRHDFERLKEWGYVLRTQSGGTWLTLAGIARAEGLRK